MQLCHSLTHWPAYQPLELPLSILSNQDSFQEWAKSTSSTSWIRMKKKAPPEPTTNHAGTTEIHRSFNYTSMMIITTLCILDVMIWVTKCLQFKILTVGKRPIWNVKGTDCNCHQSSKLKEPKSENKQVMANYTIEYTSTYRQLSCNKVTSKSYNVQS